MCVCMGSAFRSLGFSLLFGAYVPGELGQIKYRFFGDAGYLRCFLAIRLRHGFGGPEVELGGLGFRV